MSKLPELQEIRYSTGRLNKEPDESALSDTQRRSEALLQLAENYFQLPVSGGEGVKDAPVVDPDVMRHRLGQLQSALGNAFRERISGGEASFTKAEISFMERVEKADIVSRFSGNSMRREWLGAQKAGKNPNGSMTVSGMMKRENDARPQGREYDRVRVSVEHNGM
jgi:hypothetical protein